MNRVFLWKLKVPLLCILFSFMIGCLVHDLGIGSLTLITGLLSAYYATNFKRVTYLFGFINYLLIAIIAFFHHLYGIVFFYILVFAPLQVQGFFSWKKQQTDENTVVIRSLGFQRAGILFIGSIFSSFLFGYILHFIPNQQLSFLDAFSNCLNLFGMVLMNLRFREAWWLWLGNNIIDFVIWTFIWLNGGTNSFMMFLVSVSYLFFNICGIIKWYCQEKELLF